MRTITEWELADRTVSVLDAVAAGETFHVTRDGVAIAEVRPIPRRRGLSTRELIEHHRRLPRVGHSGTRAEAETFFGGADRVGSDDLTGE
ncbi:type II toxin-antitoxin system Phd/YefM family antitoxin [Nocardiopsis sp. LOL_012]|uniref:type II toxin-antitoxin system Phd/YefM family antitoxin n=1 Tax=Nocardiopsis sp. LOL_012 TaxID=3345409 RepID=UPI003A86DBAB